MLKEKILKWTAPFLRSEILGVDVSDLSIKFLQFHPRGEKSLQLKYFNDLTIPAGIIKKGEIQNEEELIKLFKGWLAKEGRRVRSSLVVASLPEEKSFVRLIQLPKIKIEEVVNAIRWEIEANIPLSPDELIFDYEIIEPLIPISDHFDVVITAFPKSIIESYVKVFRGAGLKIGALELESQAIVRAMVTSLRDPKARILIDFGHTRTSFIIFSGGALVFTITIEFGGRNLEENIAKNLAVSPQKALEIKYNVGMDRRAMDGKILGAILPALTIISDELKRTVGYYQNHVSHLHGANEDIDEIILVGGDANLYGLDTYLSSALKIPTRTFSPFERMTSTLDPLIPPIERRKSLAFATAIGLALRDIKK